jgi:hypothetical protein
VTIALENLNTFVALVIGFWTVFLLGDLLWFVRRPRDDEALSLHADRLVQIACEIALYCGLYGLMIALTP